MSRLRQCTGCICTGVLNNPVTARLLGLCPLLAVSNTVVKGLALSLLLGMVVLLSAIITSIFRNFVSWRLKPMHHALIAAFATAVVISIASIQCFELVAALGIYPALIASNCLVLSVMQELADRNTLARTTPQVTRDVVYVIIFFGLFGVLREFAAYGSTFTDLQLVYGVYPLESVALVGPMPLMATAPGAVLTLALCLAGVNAVINQYRQRDGLVSRPMANGCSAASSRNSI